ncbi:S-type anion channel SLAH2 [Triticum urartu]|uniref:S-type anion channel SLAH2 n=1 Tax=Triticum urartu TaxID=4572 RepID=M7ZEG9_TRIUA|nr:S-type anion channel SLAH2 [Triticum urartu]
MAGRGASISRIRMAGLPGTGAGGHHAVPTGGAAVAVHGEPTLGDTPLSVSFSVPSSPSGIHLAQGRLRMPPSAHASIAEVHATPVLPSESEQVEGRHLVVPQLVKHAQHHSQSSLVIQSAGEGPRSNSTRELDRQFDQFRTFSGRHNRQLSNLRGLPQDPPGTDVEHGAVSKLFEEDTNEDDDVPTADRYFAALEGPEFDTLRPSDAMEDAPVGALAFLRVHPAVSHVLWWISLALTVIVSITYLLKVVFYFEAVRREFHHPVRVNFFFAPWITCLFLVKGVPHPVWEIHHVVWYLLMAPIFWLDIKIYGQWMSSGERRLSKVANPSNHLAIVGNFVGALLGARMGLRELPIFFFAVGFAHYVVLFVTLYQRLPTNMQLPKDLHPVFFLFVAAPSVASMAWTRISGEFSDGAKLLYYVSLFLYVSLVVRVNLFWGFRFSLAWWAYTFPMTSVALATVLYASEVDNLVTRAMALGLSGIATMTIIVVLAATMYHALVRGDLFPNDVSITITKQRPKFSKILAHLQTCGSDVKELVVSNPNFNSNSKQGAYSDDSDSNARMNN